MSNPARESPTINTIVLTGRMSEASPELDLARRRGAIASRKQLTLKKNMENRLLQEKSCKEECLKKERDNQRNVSRLRLQNVNEEVKLNGTLTLSLLDYEIGM